MTRFCYFLSGIFFVLCKTFWACLFVFFDTVTHFCDRAELWCEVRRQRAVHRFSKPIRPNIRRAL